MNLENAGLLVLAVYGLTEFGKRFIGPKLSENPRVVAALAIVVGQLATWLVGETAWAHEQVLGSKPLDELNTASKILVGLIVAGVAAAGAELLGASKNWGQNQPTSMAKALANVKAFPDTHTDQPKTDPPVGPTPVTPAPITFEE
jgi:hypothetical protein